MSNEPNVELDRVGDPAADLVEPAGRPPGRLGLFGRLHYRRVSKADVPPVTHQVSVHPDIPVTMSGGVRLLADHWEPQGTPTNGPTLLIRTPYGRDGSAADARIFAERGHHVLVQSCRGAFGSGGTFDPFFDEENDGRDTIDWLQQRPWFTGSVHTLGPSYLGITQWALAEQQPESLKAMTITVSARSVVDSIIHQGNGFGMDSALAWNLALHYQERSTPVKLFAQLRAKSIIAKAVDAVPPSSAVRSAIGADSAFFQDWLAHDQADPWWDRVRFGGNTSAVPPTVLVAGWYDLFGQHQIEDFRALQDAGRPARLIVGPWTHATPTPGQLAVAESLRQLADVDAVHADPDAVRLLPIGSKTWHTFTRWPPPAENRTLFPTVDGRLAEAPDPAAGEAGYPYDPSDPTPMAGGRSLNPFTAGRKKQAVREDRDDVLCWTTAPLAKRTLIAGDVVATVVLTSTNPTVDLFVRLCQVDARGRSWNLTDGYQRLARPDNDDRSAAARQAGEVRTVELTLSGTAAEIRAGHRLRLQISSGAHPLHLRNPGTDDPVRDFGSLIRSDQRVRLGANGSRVVIPVAAETS